jgi:hypothetical protein
MGNRGSQCVGVGWGAGGWGTSVGGGSSQRGSLNISSSAMSFCLKATFVSKPLLPKKAMPESGLDRVLCGTFARTQSRIQVQADAAG